MAEPSEYSTVARSPWRGIRSRLVGVMLVPIVAALVFGLIQMNEAVSTSSEASRAESLADALPASFDLAVQLTVERDAGSVARLPSSQLATVLDATDTAIDTWRPYLETIDSSEDPELEKDLDSISASLDRIGELRQQIADPATREKARKQYTKTTNTLLDLAERLPALDDARIYEQVYALENTRQASEDLAVERAIVSQALETGVFGPVLRAELVTTEANWQAVTSSFYEHTSQDAREAWEQATEGSPMDGGSATQMQGLVDKLIRTSDPASLGVTPEEWLVISADFVEQVKDVIVVAAEDLSADVTQVREDAQRTSLITLALILLVLLVALAVAILAARSILRPLNRVRREALDIAHHQLPERVRRMEDAEGPVDDSVEPIDVPRHDEIGEVAEAFDAVHAQALRLAGEQAAMRANVNRMFVNLSRRSQSLVERQLRLIDQLEASEQDPDDLANLFQLDHLATRMRRNDESLLVLAGGDTGQNARGEVPALDVLRAAASEIEQFARVEVRAPDGVLVPGQVAGDLVHLLAELIENATNFSPPNTPIVVDGSRVDQAGPLVIEISDLGIGLTPAELQSANAKLQQSTGLDADVARMMGLVVTARLAHRHGFTVDLRANTPRGVVARVEVPAAALSVGAVGAGVAGGTAGLAAADQAAPGYDVPTRSVPASDPWPTDSRSPLADTGEGWFDATAPFGDPADTSPNGLTHTTTNGSANGWTGGSAADVPVPSTPLPQRRPAQAAPEPVAERHPDGPDDPLTSEMAAVDGNEGSSPIYSDLQSEWFRRRTPGGVRHHDRNAESSGLAYRRVDPADDPLSPEWVSPGDEGWRRAAELSEREQPAALTADGLPKRVPGQNLIPGAAAEAPAPTPQRGPDRNRARGMSSFQQGVSRARSGDTVQIEKTTDRSEGREEQ